MNDSNEIENNRTVLEKGLKPMFSNTSMPPVTPPKKETATGLDISATYQLENKEQTLTTTLTDTGEESHDE